MDSIKIDFFIPENNNLKRELLIADLSEIGFDAFQETEDRISAFISEADFCNNKLSGIVEKYKEFDNSKEKIAYRDWNAEWEKNYTPIIINKQVLVKSDFHEIDEKDFKYVININPKMTFGTGHHQTTRLMIKKMLDFSFTAKRILDWGTGTGILAILSEKRGAEYIDATDIEIIATENAKENVANNKCRNCKVLNSDIKELNNKDYDFILANINKNTLISNADLISEKLAKNGILIISGIFKSDIEEIKNIYKKNGLKFDHLISENKWCAASFLK